GVLDGGRVPAGPTSSHPMSHHQTGADAASEAKAVGVGMGVGEAVGVGVGVANPQRADSGGREDSSNQ
ncbi:MAG: hypothetical protein ACOC0P_01320, partial [Planctomycetota bacterium]